MHRPREHRHHQLQGREKVVYTDMALVGMTISSGGADRGLNTVIISCIEESSFGTTTACMVGNSWGPRRVRVIIVSGSEAGSYLRLIDFVYHSTLGLRVIKKKKRRNPWGPRRVRVNIVIINCTGEPSSSLLSVQVLEGP